MYRGMSIPVVCKETTIIRGAFVQIENRVVCKANIENNNYYSGVQKCLRNSLIAHTNHFIMRQFADSKKDPSTCIESIANVTDTSLYSFDEAYSIQVTAMMRMMSLIDYKLIKPTNLCKYCEI